jgi:hypothetical protein
MLFYAFLILVVVCCCFCVSVDGVKERCGVCLTYCTFHLSTSDLFLVAIPKEHHRRRLFFGGPVDTP